MNPKARSLKVRKSKALYKPLPLNFLLGCPEKSLGTFELARLAEVADLRKELHTILDRLIDQMSQAALASWFRASDRQAIRYAIENEETPLQMAARMVRDGQRSDEEEELIPLPSLPPGAAHLAANMRYQERNIAEGKCALCPKPQDRNSVRFCTKHLMAARLRMTPSKGKPGSVGWLYGETEESTHGRQPGTLASLEMEREKRTRALLAEIGVSPESAAVGVKAAKDALLKLLPNSEARAMTQDSLFEAAAIPTRTTGQKALKQLLADGAIQRVGVGARGNPFRYFKQSIASEDRAARTLT
jgi:hypothetical protein